MIKEVIGISRYEKSGYRKIAIYYVEDFMQPTRESAAASTSVNSGKRCGYIVANDGEQWDNIKVGTFIEDFHSKIFYTKEDHRPFEAVVGYFECPHTK